VTATAAALRVAVLELPDPRVSLERVERESVESLLTVPAHAGRLNTSMTKAAKTQRAKVQSQVMSATQYMSG